MRAQILLVFLSLCKLYYFIFHKYRIYFKTNNVCIVFGRGFRLINLLLRGFFFFRSNLAFGLSKMKLRNFYFFSNKKFYFRDFSITVWGGDFGSWGRLCESRLLDYLEHNMSRSVKNASHKVAPLFHKVTPSYGILYTKCNKDLNDPKIYIS